MSLTEHILVPICESMESVGAGLPFVTIEGAVPRLFFGREQAQAGRPQKETTRRAGGEATAEAGQVLQTFSNDDAPSHPGDRTIVAGRTFETDTGAFIELHFDPSSAFARLVARSRWECVPHGERYSGEKAGQCPVHKDGVLKRV